MNLSTNFGSNTNFGICAFCFAFLLERKAGSLKIKKAVYGGSFDPLTRGHLWIIEKALSLFDELIIVIGVNTNKKDFLCLREREENIQFFLDSMTSKASTASAKLKTIENQYMAQFALSVNASCLVRGLRCQKDFNYEYTMAQVNRNLAPSIETIYMAPPPHLAHLSSSLVKSLVGSKGWEKLISSYVPENVLKSIQKKLTKNQIPN